MRLFRLNPLAVLGLLFVLLLLMLLIYPVEGVNAAVRGILIWWDVLFPALFPFFVISELMLGFGMVHFFGSLLDPVMRPIFRVPGIGGFVLTIGFASGYPVAARLTSQLWEQRMVTREEGERLVGFITTSDPIFLIGAVSVGFFHDPGLAVVLGAAHYGSALLVGLLMRYHGGGAMGEDDTSPVKGSALKRAFEAMHAARLQDGRPFGLMLQQAIRSGIQMVFVIGGLVVFFSTVLAMLSAGHLLQAMHTGSGWLLQWVGFPKELADAVVGGLFEVTLGAKGAGGAGAAVPLVYKAAMGAFILSWAGLSVHAQIVSVLHRTNLRYLPFLLARALHGVLSAAGVMLLWNFLAPVGSRAGAAMAAWASNGLEPVGFIRSMTVPGSLLSFVLLTAALVLLASLHRFHIKMNEWLGKY